MASTPNKSLAEQNTIASTFSYAQAAKGRTPLKSISAFPSSCGFSSQSPSSMNTSSYQTVQTQNSNGAIDSTEMQQSSGSGPSSLNADIESSPDARTADDAEQVPATALTSVKEASTPVVHSFSDATWERQPLNSNTADKPTEGTEGRRSKKSKKTKDAEKEAEKAKEEAKLELLVAAPVPTVNIWQQRKEAQAAKIKPTNIATQATATTVNGSPIQNGPKNADSKKKSKSDDTAISQQGTQGKAQKKNTDGGNRDAGSKRTAPRGSREDRLAPPPVEDAVSWPTPETAIEEEKRKNIEKGDDKDDNASKQPRTKEKWVPVPYTPSVTFNTPLPSRGGRGRGGARGGRETGGRGGHVTSSANNLDKAAGSFSNGVAPESRERGRDGNNIARATSLPPNASKRNATEGQQNTRDQHKSSTSTPNDKPKSGDKEAAPEGRRTSVATQTDAGYESTQNAAADSTQINGVANGNGSNATSQLKYGESDQRHSQDTRGPENQKGNAAFAPSRGEGRSDRGRGGFRGRGSHNNFANGSSHVFTNGHAPQTQNGFVPRANAGPYSPPLQAPAFNAQYGAAPIRNGRGNPRSQSIPNGVPYGRYSANGNGVQHINPLQSSAQMVDYTGQQAVNGGQYPHYIDQWAILSMVSMQLEYYFSIDNLCKDVFLRKHMDSQGFVFLNFIATFKRIEKLTQDFESLRIAVQQVPSIEHIVGHDGFDRVRRREGWEQWVLNVEEREEAAKNAGPSQLHQPQYMRPQPMNPQMHMQGNYIPSPLFSPGGTDISYRSNGMETLNGSSINGSNHQIETALSAAVPNFAPGMPMLNGADYPAEETTFTDADVENLNLVSKPRDGAKTKAPFYNSSSRTFSNGSIDGRAFADDAHRATHQTGDVKNEVTESESSMNSPSKQSDVSPPVMWVKGQKGQAPIDPNHATEPYTSVRAKALRQRETTPIGQTHSDMKIIYEFWSHFLVRNFNPSMYEEFRQLAAEDAFQRHTMVGMDNLIIYYDEVLNSKKKIIPETIAQHYIELIKTEGTTQDRPAFSKLRASWRNGALDLKSRKRIDKFVDAELRKELES